MMAIALILESWNLYKSKLNISSHLIKKLLTMALTKVKGWLIS
jgi:hypothetical protein